MQPAKASQILRFFFRPQGRIARREFVLGVGMILAIEAAAFALLLGHAGLESALVAVFTLLAIPLGVAMLMLVAKRCHDVGLPGSYVLLLFVPVIGVGWLAFLALAPGKDGPNAYGPAPKFIGD